MSTRKLTAHRSALGDTWRGFALIATALLWCSVVYFMRQPPSPWAFDLPQAQVSSHINNVWGLRYPSTIANCGSLGADKPWCNNFCDRDARVRYIECSLP